MAKKSNKYRAPVAVMEDRVARELANMKHKDLQKACILRGLPSDQMVEMDHHKLVSWLYKNFDNTQDEQKLIEHDLWVEEQLVNRGYKKGTDFLHPALKFAAIPEDVEKISTGRVKADKPNISNVPKEKKERAQVDEATGVRSGTKKHLTFTLAQQGEKIEDVIAKVKDKFSDAEEKSIRIWFKRALKAQKTTNE